MFDIVRIRRALVFICHFAKPPRYTPLLCALQLYVGLAAAQAPAAGGETESARGVSAYGGALLPSHIGDVHEIINVFGIRYSERLKIGSVELDFFSGRGDGDIYHSFSTDYRLDFRGDVVAHFLLGAHLDYFNPESQGFKPALGWHYGGGMMLPLSAVWGLRFDFKYRFSPGNSLLIGLGFDIQFPSGGAAE